MTNAQTYLGKMLWFNEEKGHGYIGTDEGERLFVAGDGFVEAPPEGPCAGRIVEFEVGEDADGRFAERARLVEEIAPRLALAPATRLEHLQNPHDIGFSIHGSTPASPPAAATTSRSK